MSESQALRRLQEIWWMVLDIIKRKLKQLSQNKYQLIIAIIIIAPILLYLGHKLISKMRSIKNKTPMLEIALSSRNNNNIQLNVIQEPLARQGMDPFQSDLFKHKDDQTHFQQIFICVKESLNDILTIDILKEISECMSL